MRHYINDKNNFCSNLNYYNTKNCRNKNENPN